MAKEKNPVERRLREVDQSRAELTAEIRRLERALKKPERLMSSPHQPAYSPSVPRYRTTAKPGAGPAMPGPAAPAEPAVSSAPERRTMVAGNETFARLFSSTRFLGAPALRHERRVQRNRALAFVAGAVILGYIVIKIIFR
jgi:hypothetical protein